MEAEDATTTDWKARVAVLEKERMEMKEEMAAVKSRVDELEAKVQWLQEAVQSQAEAKRRRKRTNPGANGESQYPVQAAKLEEMGYTDRDATERALKKCKGNLERTVSELLRAGSMDRAQANALRHPEYKCCVAGCSQVCSLLYGMHCLAEKCDARTSERADDHRDCRYKRFVAGSDYSEYIKLYCSNPPCMPPLITKTISKAQYAALFVCKLHLKYDGETLEVERNPWNTKVVEVIPEETHFKLGSWQVAANPKAPSGFNVFSIGPESMNKTIVDAEIPNNAILRWVPEAELAPSPVADHDTPRAATCTSPAAAPPS